MAYILSTRYPFRLAGWNMAQIRFFLFEIVEPRIEPEHLKSERAVTNPWIIWGLWPTHESPDRTVTNPWIIWEGCDQPMNHLRGLWPTHESMMVIIMSNILQKTWIYPIQGLYLFTIRWNLPEVIYTKKSNVQQTEFEIQKKRHSINNELSTVAALAFANICVHIDCQLTTDINLHWTHYHTWSHLNMVLLLLLNEWKPETVNWYYICHLIN